MGPQRIGEDLQFDKDLHPGAQPRRQVVIEQRAGRSAGQLGR